MIAAVEKGARAGGCRSFGFEYRQTATKKRSTTRKQRIAANWKPLSKVYHTRWESEKLPPSTHFAIWDMHNAAYPSSENETLGKLDWGVDDIIAHTARKSCLNHTKLKMVVIWSILLAPPPQLQPQTKVPFKCVYEHNTGPSYVGIQPLGQASIVRSWKIVIIIARSHHVSSGSNLSEEWNCLFDTTGSFCFVFPAPGWSVIFKPFKLAMKGTLATENAPLAAVYITMVIRSRWRRFTSCGSTKRYDRISIQPFHRWRAAKY